MNWPKVFSFTGLALAGGATLAEPAPEVPRRTLAQFMELAEREGAQLDEQRGKIEFAKAREQFAASQAMPSGYIETLGGAVPGATGDAVTGRTVWNNWGPFWVSKAEATLPIYTFGALGSGREAARAGTKAEEHLLERDRWALRTQVAELYYEYQLAFEFSDLSENTANDLSKALEKAEKRFPRDAVKLRVYYDEARVRLTEAHKGMEETRIGMAWKTGRYGREVPRWDQANLVPRALELRSAEDYKAICLENRPELKALKMEIEAKTALVGVEHGLSLPAFFAVGQITYAAAPTRQEQTSPFAYDPTHGVTGGALLGVRWNLGFLERNAKLGQARAELIQAEGKSHHYEAGIFAEVEKNYLDTQQAMEALLIRQEAALAAKRLFRDLLVGYTLGTNTDARGLIEALGQYVLSEKARLEAIYAQNMAIVKLEQAIGKSLS